MRVGLLYALGPDGLGNGSGYDDALDQIEEADRVGLDSVLFEEHHGDRGCPAVGSLVCAAAARTKTIRVGAANRTVVLDHPVRVAEDFSVADLIAHGRVILGVSPGERPEEFRASGVPWDTRDAHFQEAVELIRLSWTQDAFQYIGGHVTFPLSAQGLPGWRREPYQPPFLDQWRRGQVVPQHLAVLPKPFQAPHPPLWVWAHRRETIEWAAARGLSLLCPSLLTDGEVMERTAWYRDALHGAGRDEAEVEIGIAREVFLAGEGDRARELAAPSLERHLEASRAETSDEHVGLAYAEGAPVSELMEKAFLVGSPLELVDRLKTLQAEAGMTHLVARVALPGRRHVDVIEAIRLLSSQVATRLVA